MAEEITYTAARYVVDPDGGIHSCSDDSVADELLDRDGWREATSEEVDLFEGPQAIAPHARAVEDRSVGNRVGDNDKSPSEITAETDSKKGKSKSDKGATTVTGGTGAH